MPSQQKYHFWFSEFDPQGLKYSYAIDQIVFQGQSEYQSIAVLDSKAYGRMLTIDGLVMITERDEFVYHELISHIPACLHTGPRKVVVIGGGDGGVVRELLKYSSIESIVLCEIDSLVIETARKYFPEVSSGFASPRVSIRVGDGVQFMKDHKLGDLDLVIVDSTDPDHIADGPGGGLFTQEFYRAVAKALKPDGLMVAQTESPWYSADILLGIHQNIRSGFKFIAPYMGPIPTYPCGYWTWTLASQNQINPHKFDRERFKSVSGSLKFLSEEGFTAAFALPPFYRQKVKL